MSDDIKKDLENASKQSNSIKDDIRSPKALKLRLTVLNIIKIDDWLLAIKKLLSTAISIFIIVMLLVYIISYEIPPIYSLLDDIQRYVLGSNIYDKFIDMNNSDFVVNPKNFKALIGLLTVRLTMLSCSIALLLFMMKRNKNEK
ncbi:hypothetical protein LO80_02530 [Candidatus Francisella endociliophora]|uniref:Uncharacterized protein n=1 Tax=Candidatus Francisella endociliophora TaxID=653937 RepID=A0A097EN25_9GAMM|nr:hypothetical protein [Francisella sp. FSC1006]AIT08968.1 hypothetical protein LO80_02530 [Francisella sp. FSC1006]